MRKITRVSVLLAVLMVLCVPVNALEISSQIRLNDIAVGESGLRIIDNGYMNCTFTVTNNSDNTKGVLFILATYTEEEKLCNLKIQKIDVPPNTEKTGECIYQFDSDEEYTGKLMFWDSVLNLMPMRAIVDFSQISGINAYYYDADNRLLQIDKANGVTMHFIYDNMGNLLSKTIRE